MLRSVLNNSGDASLYFCKNLYSLAPYAKVWFPWKCFPESQMAQDCIIDIIAQAHYKYRSIFCYHLCLPLSLCWPPFYSPSYSLRTSVKFTCTVFFSYSYKASRGSQMAWHKVMVNTVFFFLTPFLRLLFLIPLTSILPFHNHYRSGFSNPQPLQSPLSVSLCF